MIRHLAIFLTVLLLGLLAIVHAADVPESNSTSKPNFIIIFTDDQGYSDLGCFGGKHVSTPRIDKMAAEGARLTSFYVAAPLCTPSRAALMTGCYAINFQEELDQNIRPAGDVKNPKPLTKIELPK